MKILFLGDIVGRPGRKLVSKALPALKKKLKPDIVIANAENLAGGKGTNRKTVDEMRRAGVDFFTGGNHTFAIDQVLELFKDPIAPLVRPANFPPGTAGLGYKIITTKNKKRLLMINLLGRTFMAQHVDCPFRALDSILAEVPTSAYDASLIDIHAEATSEKQALRWYVDGKISAVIGTHTHVQTADADISPQGTAYLTDAGMNGSFDSCLGVQKELIIEKLRSQMPVSHELEEKGRMQVNGVLITVGANGKAKSIRLIREISA